MRPAASFFFDLASPDAYLAAERVLHVLGGPAEWQPVLARDLGAPHSRAPARVAAVDGPDTPEAPADGRWRLALAARAHELQLQPLRWPEPYPFDSALAMRVATYAKSIGRAVPFAQAAFRQAYAGGRNLEDPDNVLIAAAACEMHPAAVLRGAELRSVHSRLAEATEQAAQAGIGSVPALLVAGSVFEGERALERAAAQMREAS